MSSYLRPRIPAASIFFTVCLADRRQSLLTDNIDRLRWSYRRMCQDRPVTTEAIVILPDHIHCVWTLPDGDHDYSTRWRLLKARFSRGLPPGVRRASHLLRAERGLWQRRFWEHHIRNEAEMQQAIRFCWNDAVRHGLVDDPFAWPHSSIHRDMAVSLRAGAALRDRRDAPSGNPPPMTGNPALSPAAPLG
ncbi:REP-associated tyrosine transposase [Jannaschia pohangensis]|uniref:Putative transposase n=1 Tax=Jannaschia pohangensis TaxID=390807 RepID=A0A1I3JL40_9RHOB|nr:transposase [Jannaschia pohangensis]SFI60884.1 putative transposase [Jannaschia pohangensis]